MTARERAEHLFAVVNGPVTDAFAVDEMERAITSAQRDERERCRMLVRSAAIHVDPESPGDNCVCAPCSAALDLARRIRALSDEGTTP